MSARDEARAALALDTGVRQSPGDSLHPMSARAVQRLRDAVEELLALLDETEPTPAADGREEAERRWGDTRRADAFVDGARWANAVGRTESTPDEREALAGLIAAHRYVDRSASTEAHCACDRWWESVQQRPRMSWGQHVADAVIAGFHRQGPITDAMVDAGARAMYARSHDLSVSGARDLFRAALEAAEAAR